jgi:hypothetical protein
MNKNILCAVDRCISLQHVTLFYGICTKSSMRCDGHNQESCRGDKRISHFANGTLYDVAEHVEQSKEEKNHEKSKRIVKIHTYCQSAVLIVMHKSCARSPSKS